MTKSRIVLASAFLGALLLLGYSRNWDFRGLETAFSHKNRAPSGSEGAQTDIINFYDVAMPVAYPRPASEWQTNEQQFYEKLLAGRHYDVLVVPFQVSYEGFDRATRALMSAELTAAIARAEPGQVPDIHVVAKVFGEGRRQIKVEEIHRIANLIGAKRIVWGGVGHTGAVKDGQRKLNINLRSQSRSSVSNAAWAVPYESEAFIGVPFSEQQPPIDAFERLLPDILSSLGFNADAAFASRLRYTLDINELPDRPIAIPSGEVNRARDAYTFLLLSELTPAHDERTKQAFVEKAFLTLSQIATESPEYRALRARALMLMGYRQAALRLLATPTGQEEEEVLAALNGNLPDVRKLAATERNPLKSLIENLDANRIAADFRILNTDSSLEAVKALALPGRIWPFLTARAFTDWDVQSQFENGSLKSLLDAEFHLEGYGLDDLVRGQMAVGDEDKLQPIVELSVFNHVRKYLEGHSAQWCCDSAIYSPRAVDYLELLSSFGDDNLIRHMYLLTVMQRLPQDALRFADSIQSVYRGNPYYAMERARAERIVAEQSTGAEQQGLMKTAYDDALNSIYWEQSQSRVSSEALLELTRNPRQDYGVFFNFYCTDIPYHPTFTTWDPAGRGLENWRAAVSNATSEFSVITNLAGNTRELRDEMVRQIQGRFIGSPERGIFLADQRLLNDDLQGAEDLLRENINLAPNVAASYLKLGKLVLQSGQPTEAEKIFLSYPELHDRRTENPIAISNTAYEMGSLFYNTGDLEIAVPMYKIAVAQETGAASGMSASMRLMLLDGKIEDAMAISLERAQRYNDGGAYRDYLSMLHATKHSAEAWAGFGTMVRVLQWPDIWESALVGHHLEGSSESQVGKWVKQGDFDAIGYRVSNAAMYLAWFATMDRIPSKDLAQVFADIDRPIWRFDDGAQSVVRPDLDGREIRILGPASAISCDGDYCATYPMGSLSNASKHRVRSPLSYFVEAYRAIKLHEYRSAKQVLTEAAELFDMSNIESSYMLPYYALASAKTGNDVAGVTRILSRFSGASQSFDSELAIAVLKGAAGKSSEALASLRLARYQRLSNSHRTLISQYTYGEFCEIVYELTNDPRIRAEGLRWAKVRERVEPWQSWTYAFEAEFTTDPFDRAKAIAMTYYLDPRSLRLSRFSKSEVDEAAKRFNGLNMFLRRGARATTT
jgi:tetratricopeptide (TPR) repeat protein